MRARNIKPDFFRDIDLAEKCCRDARLLFAGLWCLADCAGRLEDKPRFIKAQVFPYDDDLSTEDVNDLLRELAAGRFIERYAVSGVDYIAVVNFLKHQNPHKKERDAGSSIPEPEIPGTDPVQTGTNPEPDPVEAGTSRADSGFLIPDTGYPDTGLRASGAPRTPVAVDNPDIQPKSPVSVETVKSDLWDCYWGMFEASGKALNETDKRKACQAFLSMPNTEQIAAHDDATRKFHDGTWPTPELTPFPANHVANRPWTRVAKPRTLPDAPRRPTSEGGIAETVARAKELLRQKEAARAGK